MSEEKPQKSRVQILWMVGVFLATFCCHTFAFAPYDVAELAYLLPIPATLWLLYVQPPMGAFIRIVGGAFWLSWLVLIFWLRHVTWIGWFALATVLAFFPLAWVYAHYLLVSQFKDRGTVLRILGIIATCSVWVIVEFVRTFFLSGFPWLPLAASQWQRPVMLQVSSLTGFYGVSFLLLMVGMVIAFYLRHLFHGKQKGWIRLCPEFLLGMTVWLFATFGLFKIKFERIERQLFFDAALIQPYVPQPDKWDPAKAEEITDEIERQITFQKHIGADIAILPEAVLPYPLIGDDGMQAWAENLTSAFGGPVLMGALTNEGETRYSDPWYNGFLIIYPQEGVARPYYKKRRLVPYGEYIPFRNIFFFLEKFVPIFSDIFPGKTAEPLRLQTSQGSISIGPLICYEDIFPGLARASVLAGARILAVVTNDAWYGEEGAAEQHAAHSVLRAVEMRRPVVRVGNGGWSGWIDEYGIIREVLQTIEGSVYFRGGEVVSVTFDPVNYQKLTVFAKYGNWFVGVCTGMILLFVVLMRTISRRLSEDEQWEQIKDLQLNVRDDKK